MERNRTDERQTVGLRFVEMQRTSRRMGQLLRQCGRTRWFHLCHGARPMTSEWLNLERVLL